MFDKDCRSKSSSRKDLKLRPKYASRVPQAVILCLLPTNQIIHSSTSIFPGSLQMTFEKTLITSNRFRTMRFRGITAQYVRTVK